jgi:hypothetical protein
MVSVCPVRMFVVVSPFAAWMASMVVPYLRASPQRLSPDATVWLAPPKAGVPGVDGVSGEVGALGCVTPGNG